MTFKQILTLVCLLASGFSGSVWADTREEEDETGELIYLAEHVYIATGDNGIDPGLACKAECDQNPSACTDFGQGRKEFPNLYPNTLSLTKRCLVPVIKQILDEKQGMAWYTFCNLRGLCMTPYSDACNAVCPPQPTKFQRNAKSKAVMSPQITNGVNAKQSMQSNHPHMLPPVNQGRNAPHQGLKSTTPEHSHEEHAPAHPGMMHVDPHHQGMLPPVNQGRNAPSVNTQHNHPGMRPVENRGRTTPPKMRTIPNATGTSQGMQPHSGGPQHNHPGNDVR